MSQIKIISRARLSKSDIKQRLQEFLQNGSCVGDIELDAIYNIAVVTMTTCKDVDKLLAYASKFEKEMGWKVIKECNPFSDVITVPLDKDWLESYLKYVSDDSLKKLQDSLKTVNVCLEKSNENCFFIIGHISDLQQAHKTMTNLLAKGLQQFSNQYIYSRHQAESKQDDYNKAYSYDDERKLNKRLNGTTSLDVSSGEKHENSKSTPKNVDSFDVDSRVWAYVKFKNSEAIKGISKHVSLKEMSYQAASVANMTVKITAVSRRLNVSDVVELLQKLYDDAMQNSQIIPLGKLDLSSSLPAVEKNSIIKFLKTVFEDFLFFEESFIGPNSSKKSIMDFASLLNHAYNNSPRVVKPLSLLTELVLIKPAKSVLTYSLLFLQKDHLYFETLNGVKVQLLKADITKQNVHAIVNSANSQLIPAGGVSKVIAKVAGKQYDKECVEVVRRHGTIRETNCRVTSGGNLVPYVIHAVGIIAKNCKNDEDRKYKMGIVFANIFKTAKTYEITSLAIPAIGTGINGVPVSIVARAAIGELMKCLSSENNSTLKDIRFVDLNSEVLDALQAEIINFIYPHVTIVKSDSGNSDVDESRPTSACSTVSKTGAVKFRPKSQKRNASVVKSNKPLAAIDYAKDRSTVSSVSSSRNTPTVSCDIDAAKLNGAVLNNSSNKIQTDISMKCILCYLDASSTKKFMCDHFYCNFCSQNMVACVVCAKHQPQLSRSASFSLNNPKVVTTGKEYSGAENSVTRSSSSRDSIKASSSRRSNSLTRVRRSSLDNDPTETKIIKRLSQSKDFDDCAICMCSITEPETLDCGHTFCKDCIKKSFQIHQPKCPACGKVFGMLKGNQPDGKMSASILYVDLPGYEGFGAIEIYYSFESGIQGPDHPHPNRPYTGTKRIAYLPNNKEGKEVYYLLKKAFEARLLFTIGNSVSTGQSDVVTWNDVHHKTQIKGQPYGYPDPTYLKRVKEELAIKGIR